jgi:hypothetical protein
MLSEERCRDYGTLIYVGERLEIDEVTELAEPFEIQYGQMFMRNARSGVDTHVHARFLRLCAVHVTPMDLYETLRATFPQHEISALPAGLS